MENQIHIKYGTIALEALQKELAEKQYSSIFILVDNNTETHCLDRFFKHCPIKVNAVMKMNAGEENKNLHTCQKLWQDLSDYGADRKSVLINLGGGVVTDLGGFVACTFKRGIAFYNIPTTLLAMVDASVGGKTGIDLGPLKNQIGVIREPEKVIVDAAWLETLPHEELRSGFAEMLKHGLIANPSYWDSLRSLTQLSPKIVENFIKTSIEEKTKVVLVDPYEKGLRKILNFGHTLGHAIESFYLTHVERPRLLHGEAIAIGMVLEAYLAVHCSGLPKVQAEEIKITFDSFYPKVALPSADQKGILELLCHDKKNKAGRVNFVLLKAIGVPEIDVDVPQTLFSKAFEFYHAT